MEREAAEARAKREAEEVARAQREAEAAERARQEEEAHRHAAGLGRADERLALPPLSLERGGQQSGIGVREGR